MRKNLPVTHIEHRVPEQSVLVSRTDLFGTITYCNRTFCEISGYSEAELLGQPHNIVRHPDVPSAYFADCWASLQVGRPWHGIIKNRCKNGDFYWVEANITPWLENGKTVGYVSLRYRPTAAQIVAAEEAYREALMPVVYTPNHDLHYIVALQQRLADKIMRLEKHRERSEEELQIGSEIMERINGMHGMTDPSVRQKISAAAYYSGDMILATRTESGVLHVLLADAVGHGLTAAINVLPLSQTFHSMSKKGFSISRIAEELNQKIHQFMPVDRFVATTLISVDCRSQRIEVWNGGNPAALLVSASGEILHRWKSRHLPLGIFDSESFSSETEVFDYKEICQLFMFSDGLPEAESPEGEAFGKQRIEGALCSSVANGRFDALIAGFERHLAGSAAHDDVSLAMIDIAPCAEPLPLPVTAPLVAGWRMALTLTADELRTVEVVTLVTHILQKIQLSLAHQSALFLILSELFNNALDHGVLGLDSGIKHGENGFENYLELRAARLAGLQQGQIEFEVEKFTLDGQAGVKIRIVDSGAGFDYRQSALTEAVNQAQHGRGLVLVRSLADKLSFGRRGNEVTVHYVCR